MSALTNTLITMCEPVLGRLDRDAYSWDVGVGVGGGERIYMYSSVGG